MIKITAIVILIMGLALLTGACDAQGYYPGGYYSPGLMTNGWYTGGWNYASFMYGYVNSMFAQIPGIGGYGSPRYNSNYQGF